MTAVCGMLVLIAKRLQKHYYKWMRLITYQGGLSITMETGKDDTGKDVECFLVLESILRTFAKLL